MSALEQEVDSRAVALYNRGMCVVMIEISGDFESISDFSERIECNDMSLCYSRHVLNAERQ